MGLLRDCHLAFGYALGVVCWDPAALASAMARTEAWMRWRRRAAKVWAFAVAAEMQGGTYRFATRADLLGAQILIETPSSPF